MTCLKAEGEFCVVIGRMWQECAECCSVLGAVLRAGDRGVELPALEKSIV